MTPQELRTLLVGTADEINRLRGVVTDVGMLKVEVERVFGPTVHALWNELRAGILGKLWIPLDGVPVQYGPHAGTELWMHFLWRFLARRIPTHAINAGAHNLPINKTDKRGRALARKGARLRFEKTIENSEIVEGKIIGDFATTWDDFSGPQLTHVFRQRYGDWADMLKKVADIVDPPAGKTRELGSDKIERKESSPMSDDLLDDPRTIQLLQSLWTASDRHAGVAIVDLPDQLRGDEIFTEWIGAELIEIVRRNHCHVGGGPHRKLVLENGWNVAQLHRPDRKRVWDLLKEVMTEDVEPQIRHRVRLARRGDAEACRIVRQLSETSKAVEPGSNETFPPDDGWHFEPGKVWFRRRFYDFGGKPSLILQRMVQSDRSTFERKDFDDIWEYDVSEVTLRSHLTTLRNLLRRIAQDFELTEDVKADPVPWKNLCWHFLLPKK